MSLFFYYPNGDSGVTIPGGEQILFRYASLMRIIFREKSVVFVFTDQSTREIVVGEYLPQLKEEMEAQIPNWHWGSSDDYPWLKPYAHH